ncbi:hypothetical protein ABID21_000679 [Pseudorhizobium tarimense]|uniref:Uncharacterized protein n=1 Tax=Pseudorhizobium tarimense TaxID=1079109 RepID=A0ABV2H272_9HYPH|nr:hypothetical protein [Pseudorhizobium tarimense]MCJ8517806.1 hypothetical protein [Pseudorhizobium tarimense]
MHDIRLVIVTDQPQRASRILLGCAVDRLPSWIRVMSGAEISELPAGAPVLAIWFSDRSFAEALYRERREQVSLDNDYGKHYQRIQDALARRDAAEKALCDDYCAEMSSRPQAQEEAGTVAADQQEVATSPSSASPPTDLPSEPLHQRQSRWT